MNAIVWGRWVSRLFNKRKAPRAPGTPPARLRDPRGPRHAGDIHLEWSGRQQQLEYRGQLAGRRRSDQPRQSRPGVQQRHVADEPQQRHPRARRQVDHHLGQQLHAQRRQDPPRRQPDRGLGASNERVNMDVELTAASYVHRQQRRRPDPQRPDDGSASLTKRGVGTLTLTSDNSLYSRRHRRADRPAHHDQRRRPGHARNRHDR